MNISKFPPAISTGPREPDIVTNVQSVPTDSPSPEMAIAEKKTKEDALKDGLPLQVSISVQGPNTRTCIMVPAETTTPAALTSDPLSSKKPTELELREELPFRDTRLNSWNVLAQTYRINLSMIYFIFGAHRRGLIRGSVAD